MHVEAVCSISNQTQHGDSKWFQNAKEDDMTQFSLKKGNKNLWLNMDVMHALLYAEISTEETKKK